MTNPFKEIPNALAVRKKRNILLFEIAMILVTLVFIYPVIFVVLNAFKPTADIATNPAGLPASVTFDNFVRVWSVQGAGGVNFQLAFLNTFVLTLLSVVGIVLLSSTAAYVLVRTRNKTSAFIFSLFTFFMVIPFQIIMVPLVVLATDLELKDSLGLILMYWGLGTPTAVFMYHGFIKSVPVSLEESASIDGAGPWRTFFQIVFPLLTPITATIAILDILWVWNDFLLPYIILRKGTLVLFQFNFFGTYSQDFGALTASLVMSATPIVVLYFLLQRYIIKGISAGAVKG